MMSFLLPSLLLCLALGSAIDTTNLCMVRAAGDWLEGRPGIALGCLVAAAAAGLVFYANTRLDLHRWPPAWAWPTVFAMAGAVVFALGAVLNGACAVGTLGRLARGEVGYVATLLGGAAVALLLPRTERPVAAPELAFAAGFAWPGLLLAAAALGLWLARRRVGWRRLLPYPLIGLAAAEITNWRGDWTWLSVLQELRAGLPVEAAALACIGAVLLGAVATAVLRRRFKLVRPAPLVMLREAAGGALMTAGALMIPGGNDALLVYGVPSGSPLAAAAYALMFGLVVALIWALPVVRRWNFIVRG